MRTDAPVSPSIATVPGVPSVHEYARRAGCPDANSSTAMGSSTAVVRYFGSLPLQGAFPAPSDIRLAARRLTKPGGAKPTSRSARQGRQLLERGIAGAVNQTPVH